MHTGPLVRDECLESIRRRRRCGTTRHLLPRRGRVRGPRGVTHLAGVIGVIEQPLDRAFWIPVLPSPLGMCILNLNGFIPFPTRLCALGPA